MNNETNTVDRAVLKSRLATLFSVANVTLNPGQLDKMADRIIAKNAVDIFMGMDPHHPGNARNLRAAAREAGYR